MPITPAQERKLLNHYKLTSLYPEAWPHQADDDDDASTSEDDDASAAPPNTDTPPTRHQSNLSMHSRSSVTNKNRFRNIDRHASLRSSISGTQKHAGVDSLVQKDEPDPLGMAPSVAGELRRRGLPVEEDVKLRNRFMLSSTSFSPALFLSQVHQDASTEELVRGMEVLSQSIEQKSASLKVLVESNFERFVKAKATIDNVYTEMRTHGSSPDTPQSPNTNNSTGRKTHSRHTSRTQASHFRNTSSGAFNPASKSPSTNAILWDKRKNALTKESEYGVAGVKAPLQDLAIKAEEVWGPALGGREKEDSVKAVLKSLDQHHDIFALSGTMAESVRKRDYEGVVAAWRGATRYADDARTLAARTKEMGGRLDESGVHFVTLTARMWFDVSRQIEGFKREVWRRLKSSHGRKGSANTTSAGGMMADEADKEEHVQLIGVLLQLGVDENPIWEWLNSRSLYLKDKIARSFERNRIELEILRRRLAASNTGDKAELGKTLAKYIRASTGSTTTALRNANETKDLDSAAILAFWENLFAALTALLSSSTGVLGEVLDFWHTTQSFIDNQAQKSLPTAVFAAGAPGREHLELEPDEVSNLRSGALDLLTRVRESVMAFFADAPVEDISDLYSPVTPESAASRRGFGQDVPPPTTSGEWEKYAFWPPFANALSGAHYLARLLTLIGTAAGEMASLSLTKQSRNGTEALKLLLNTVRERSVAALSAAWVSDAEKVKYVEDWAREKERRDLTRMPERFREWEERVLAGVQRIAYVSEVAASGGQEGVVTPPPAKLLQIVRQGFVTGLYRALSGMVENAEKVVKAGEAGDGMMMVGEGGAEGAGGDRVSFAPLVRPPVLL